MEFDTATTLCGIQNLQINPDRFPVSHKNKPRFN